MAIARLADLVWHLGFVHLFDQYAHHPALALVIRDNIGHLLKCFGQHANEASVAGTWVPIVLVDFFFCAHAGLGLVVAIGNGSSYLPSSLVA